MDFKKSIKLLFPHFYIWNCTRVHRRHSHLDEAEIKKEICRIYKSHFGRDLDWNNLRRYTEKMQWKKIYYTKPLERIVSDKYAVRQWVADKIGPEHLIPMIGVWEKFEDIDFNSMPNSFVLKTTHASSNNFIVKDKQLFDKKYAALMFKLWLSVDYSYVSFEMNYRDIPRRIIAEKYMKDRNGEFKDYKFMCFDGKPYCCWVDVDRFGNHTRDIFDMNWELLPFTNCFPNSITPAQKPNNFDEMKEIATTLSEGFSHVRVDLYNVDDTIYFGELTFCESSGFGDIQPDEYDLKLGEMWNLPINYD